MLPSTPFLLSARAKVAVLENQHWKKLPYTLCNTQGIETSRARGRRRGRRSQAAAACPPPPWPPSPPAAAANTRDQVGGAGRGRELVVLEVQTEARRSEGDERKVGGCQSETRTPPPIPVNMVYGHFAKCTIVKSQHTCFRKYSADADPLAPELKLSTNLSFHIFFSCTFLLKTDGLKWLELH